MITRKQPKTDPLMQPYYVSCSKVLHEIYINDVYAGDVELLNGDTVVYCASLEYWDNFGTGAKTIEELAAHLRAIEEEERAKR